MFDVGTGEMLLVVILALLLFGGNLPDVVRSVARTIGSLKRSLSEVTEPLRETRDGLREEMRRVASSARVDLDAADAVRERADVGAMPRSEEDPEEAGDPAPGDPARDAD